MGNIEEHCQERYGEGVQFERIRRITGYLVGDYKTRFNDAKMKECEDRLGHYDEDSCNNDSMLYNGRSDNKVGG